MVHNASQLHFQQTSSNKLHKNAGAIFVRHATKFTLLELDRFGREQYLRWVCTGPRKCTCNEFYAAVLFLFITILEIEVQNASQMYL